MLIHKKKKEIRYFKNHLTKKLQNFWKNGYNPSLKELKNDLNLRNVQLLKNTLRVLRTEKVLDGSYDEEGVYRIYPFKSLTSKSVLYSNLYDT